MRWLRGAEYGRPVFEASRIRFVVAVESVGARERDLRVAVTKEGTVEIGTQCCETGWRFYVLAMRVSIARI